MDKPTVESLVTTKTVFMNCYNICHLAVISSQERLPKIFGFLQSTFDPGEAKRMLCATTAQNHNILHLAVRFGKPFKPLFDSLKPLLTADEFRGVVFLGNAPHDTVFITALEFDRHNDLEGIVNCYVEEFGEETVKAVISAPGFVCAALEGVKSSEALRCFLAQLSKFFDEGRISRWLMAFDPRNFVTDNQEIVNHLAVTVTDLSFKANIKEFKDNILHVIISNEDADTLDKYWWHIKKEIPDLWHKAWRKRLSNGDTIIHSAIRAGHAQIIFTLFWHLLRTQILHQMLPNKNNAGLTAVDLAVNCDRVDLLRLIMDFVAKDDYYSPEKIKLVPSNLPSGPTIFHSVTRLFDSSVANRAFSVCLKSLSAAEMNKIFNIPNHDGFSLFQICILGGNFCAVQKMFSGFSFTACKDVWKKITKNRENALHLAARSGKVEMFEYVGHLVKVYLETEGLKDMATAVNSSGSNILHMMALENNRKLMEAGMKLVFRHAGGMAAIMKMLAAKNEIGHTVGDIVKFFEDQYDLTKVAVLSSLDLGDYPDYLKQKHL
jgi:ankyrin repeat protein